MKDLENKLIKIKPRRLSETEKSVLWSKIEDGASREKIPYERFLFGISPKFVISASLVVFILSGGFVTASTADAAVPGDKMFPVDEFIEKAELFFAWGDKKSERRLEFANERYAEAQEVISEVDISEPAESVSTGDEYAVSLSRFFRAEYTLSVALVRLEALRDALVGEGNDEAVAEIDAIIADLTALADSHLAFLGELASLSEELGEITKDDVKDLREDVRDEAKYLREGVRESIDGLRFRFDYRVAVAGEDVEGGGYVTNPGRERIVELFDSHDGDWKATLCHYPPGNSGNPVTIEVGSPASKRFYLDLGATEGECITTDSNEVRGASVGPVGPPSVETNPADNSNSPKNQ